MLVGQILTNAQKMEWNWQGWFMGIFGAVISGMAAFLSSGLSVAMVDPDHFNLGSGLHKLMAVVFLSGGVSSATSLGKYLYAHPTPDPVVPEK